MGARTVEIRLDRPRRLKLDFNALADFEEAGGDVAAMAEGVGGFKNIRLLLWAGLKWNDRSMTREKAGELLQTHLDNDGTLEAIVKLIADAMTKAGMGKQEGEEVDGLGEASTPEPSDSQQ